MQSPRPGENSESRFLKSFKYKHKLGAGDKVYQRKTSNGCDKLRIVFNYGLALVALASIPNSVSAFCPYKCHCNDQLLSVNCTQISSISIVPMTLNPLLRHMMLNQLPLYELSNSLSVYRQLEVLNLRSNQLRQIKYENFNFKQLKSGTSITLNLNHFHSSSATNYPANNHDELNQNNEQLARHFKMAIDKSLPSSTSPSSDEGSSDEIRFHLRELDLSDNRIDQLGEMLIDEEFDGFGESEKFKRLRSSDLERQSPFLTLSRLEILSLAGNRLSNLNQHAFLGLVRLKKLDLSRNYLEYLNKHSFVGLIELEILNLSQNKLAKQLNVISLSFCRAPMSELRHLDLSENYASTGYGPRQSIVIDGLATDNVVPNQMFICTPRLITLKLNSLQLKHLQGNSLDNLQQLESLNLSRNFLDQVPSEAFDRSRLHLSLRQLDLSETLIESVNMKSLNSLKKLQKLTMNRMPMLVNFDLASVHHQLNEEHIYVNDHLMELELKQNSRLQSFHSSLANQMSEAGRIRFSKLRELNLEANGELRELALDRIIDLNAISYQENKLRVDLSYSSKLNCSSCQMSWLINLAKQQIRSRTMPSLMIAQNYFDPNAFNANQNQVILSSDLATVGCISPFAMPLAQLLDLDSSFAPLFSNCYNQPSGFAQSEPGHGGIAPLFNQQAPGISDLNSLSINPITNDLPSLKDANNIRLADVQAHESPSVDLPTALLCGFLLIALSVIAIKLLLSLLLGSDKLYNWLNWSTPETGTNSLANESFPNSASSPADCSSSSILSAPNNQAAAGQLQLQLQQQQILFYSTLNNRSNQLMTLGNGFKENHHFIGQINNNVPKRGSNLFFRLIERTFSRKRKNNENADASKWLQQTIGETSNDNGAYEGMGPLSNGNNKILNQYIYSAAEQEPVYYSSCHQQPHDPPAPAASAPSDGQLIEPTQHQKQMLARGEPNNQVIAVAGKYYQQQLGGHLSKQQQFSPRYSSGSNSSATLLNASNSLSSGGNYSATSGRKSSLVSPLARLDVGADPAEPAGNNLKTSPLLVDGHIYVTLDGPIKQRAGQQDEYFVVYEQPERAFAQATTTTAGKLNSLFENEEDGYGSSSFKLRDKLADGGSTSRELGAPNGSGGFKLAAKRPTARLAPEERVAAANVFIGGDKIGTDLNGAGELQQQQHSAQTATRQRRNVTSQLDGRAAAGDRLASDRQLLFEETNPSGGSLTRAQHNERLMDEPGIKAKYDVDANHDVATAIVAKPSSASTTPSRNLVSGSNNDNDNNYIINGSRGKAERNFSFEANARGVALDGLKCADYSGSRPAKNMIHQQENAHQSNSNSNAECDNLPRSKSNGKQARGSATNNEIYSNQFYYCRPTLARPDPDQPDK